MTARPRWALAIRLFHWVSAIGIVAMLGLGVAMTQLVADPGRRFDLYQLHKSLGLMLLLVLAARLVWRIAFSSPPSPLDHGETPARLMHAMLYVLSIGLALAGYAMVSTSSLPLPVELPFGLTAPNLLSPNEAQSEFFKTAHHLLAAALAFCLAGHVAAALKRHFVDRDGTLRRMWLF
jgi:cytochrome b561